MNWKQIQEIYVQETQALKPIARDRALLEYNYLRENINNCLPEAFENPSVITSTHWEQLIKTLESNALDTNLQFRRSGDALSKVHAIIKKYNNLPVLNNSLHAKKKALSKEQVTWCFAEFLKKNEFHHITTSIFQPCEADVIADKDDVHFFALAIGSPVRTKNATTKDAATIFKTDFALCLLVLMERMTTSSEIIPSILISNDDTSHQLISHYQQVLKMGIKIFLVTSAEKVELLEDEA